MSRGKPCFISIHAPRTGSDPCSGVDIWLREISIHAPRTGSDDFLKCRVVVEVVISIHAPRTGSDVREADVDGQLLDFNPRSPHGERQLFRPFLHAFCLFQSTLPARGATSASCLEQFDFEEFQSTLPARGATEKRAEAARIGKISIHAPRTGSDGGQRRGRGAGMRISIHAPRTGSDDIDSLYLLCWYAISIHAPRTGSDLLPRVRLGQTSGFQSTLPARGATLECVKIAGESGFQSTLPARGATA